MGEEPDATPEERRSLFRVVSGAPTDAEIAALTVVLATAAATTPSAGAGRRAAWNDPAARMRTLRRPGPDAWRTAYWPR